jgi:type IV pilus assembly protein PilB
MSALASGLTKKLISEGLLAEAQLPQLLEEAAKQQQSLVGYLVTQKKVSALKLAILASQEFGLPFFDLDAFDTSMLPKVEVKDLQVLPLWKRGTKLFVALDDPTTIDNLEKLKFNTGLTPELIIVEADKLAIILEKTNSMQEFGSFSDLDNANLEALDITHEDDNPGETINADDAPVVRFVNKIILDAINNGASDVHFEPYEKTFRVRFRQDGILREHASPPANLASRIAARLKIMAQLDIAERRMPQDGRFKMRISKNKTIDFRVSSCPTLFGEKIVIRVLDPANAKVTIDQLGYEDFQKELFLNAINLPQGMVLVTGPTGSGKTISLYTALNILNLPERNISTAEDPVEINLPGINQVNVKSKIGLNFATALRSFLRQDPDVIMVGEIRDLETAEIAIKAAQTGHMVLSTLHTNSAAETIARLINMGIPAFNLAGSLNLIVAQRLARRLCDKCKQAQDIPLAAKIEMGFTEAEAAEVVLYKAVGCNVCHEGYRGRVGLYEVMPITNSLSKIILEGANVMELRAQAEKEGVWSIRKAGLHKVKLGITSMEEISRVTKE